MTPHKLVLDPLVIRSRLYNYNDDNVTILRPFYLIDTLIDNVGTEISISMLLELLCRPVSCMRAGAPNRKSSSRRTPIVNEIWATN